MNPICFLLFLQMYAVQGVQPDVVVAGIVRDDAGNPLAGAEVFLAVASQSNEEREVGACGTTNERGEFSLAIDPQALKADHYCLMAHKPGYGLNHGDFVPGRSEQPAEIRLKPMESMSLRVLGPSGEPVPNARLRFAGFHFGRGTMQIAPIKNRFEFVANDIGEVQVEQFANSRAVIFFVDTKEFGMQLGSAFVSSQSNLTLGRVGKIQGRVLGPVGCNSASVVVIVQSRNADCTSINGGFAAAVTNQMGEFEIPAILAGSLTIEAKLPPDFEFDHPPSKLIVEPDAVTDFDLKLERVKHLVGICRDLKTQEPIPDAVAWIRNDQFRQVINPDVSLEGDYVNQNVKTNESGEYQFKVISGVYGLRVLARRGYVSAIHPQRQIEINESFVDGDTPSGAVFELERAADVTGRVIDEQGQPVAGAKVIASWQQLADSSFPLRQAQATSTESGEFTILDAWCGGPLRITASSDTAATAGSIEYVAGRQSKLELVLLRSESIGVSGRVVDAQGKGIKARVNIWENIPNEYGKASDHQIFPGCFGIQCEEDGAFSVPVKLPRSRSLELQAIEQGFTKCQVMLDFDSAIDGKLHLADIVLEPAKK